MTQKLRHRFSTVERWKVGQWRND